MTTISATKGEFVNLINGLFAVQELKGKKFGLSVSQNLTLLQEALKELEEMGIPSPEFLSLAQEVNKISQEDPEGAAGRIETLEKENTVLVQERKDQVEKVTTAMLEPMELKLKTMSEDLLPADITAQQISGIHQLIA